MTRLCLLVLAMLVAGCGIDGSRASATAASGTGAWRPCPSEDASDVVERVNDVRRRVGLRALASDPRIAQIATTRSAAMAAERRLSHRGWERALREAGLRDDQLGENVAYNYGSAAAVMDGWMESVSHRDEHPPPRLQAHRRRLRDRRARAPLVDAGFRRLKTPVAVGASARHRSGAAMSDLRATLFERLRDPRAVPILARHAIPVIGVFVLGWSVLETIAALFLDALSTLWLARRDGLVLRREGARLGRTPASCSAAVLGRRPRHVFS